MAASIEKCVELHYTIPGLLQAILDGVAASGIGSRDLSPEDLAPVDEFHLAGRLTTMRALDLMTLEAGMHVLDAGCGIGGTARCMAVERGCRVTGLDLTPEFVDVARALTARLGLDGQCAFDLGSVLAMPYEAAAFDAAVTFHLAMNVENRERFYGELARVVRSGGQLCVFDLMRGPAEGMPYPVPWADSPATSFLRTRDEAVALLTQAGFDIVAEQNLRRFGIEYLRGMLEKSAHEDSPPPLGLHLLTGQRAGEKFVNAMKALEAHQIEPVMIAAIRR